LTAVSTKSYYLFTLTVRIRTTGNMENNKQTETETRRQFKLQLDDTFLTELTTCSKRYARRSPQAAAEEILTLYFPHWKEAAERALDAPKIAQEQLEEAAL
jgi:hypothetical protein